jgi:hypothetical protein
MTGGRMSGRNISNAKSAMKALAWTGCERNSAVVNLNMGSPPPAIYLIFRTFSFAGLPLAALLTATGSISGRMGFRGGRNSSTNAAARSGSGPRARWLWA